MLNIDDTPPVFNPPTNASINENETEAIALNVEDDTALTFTLSGADESLFDIDSNGLVTFKTAPDYENPSDSDGDNVYNFTVTAKDEAGYETSQDITITVLDMDEAPPVFNDPLSSSVNENQTSAITLN